MKKAEGVKSGMQQMLDNAQPKQLERREEIKMIDPVEMAMKIIDKTIYQAINQFGWDQQDKKVKIYITSGIDGVGSLPKG